MATIFERALEYVPAGATIGLGSGRTSSEFIRLLGARVRAGFSVRGVPTSQASTALAEREGIPLISLEAGIPLAVTVDGADEVDPNLNLIKGYGRALVREKVVAAASGKLIIIVGPGKEVPQLGARRKLPVEVVPFALPLVRRQLQQLGCQPNLYEHDGQYVPTDNGNAIIDCVIPPLGHPSELEAKVLAIPGVIDTGFFLDMAAVVLIGDEKFQLVKERVR
jgi:ribose 5-phosphate isomerase A